MEDRGDGNLRGRQAFLCISPRYKNPLILKSVGFKKTEEKKEKPYVNLSSSGGFCDNPVFWIASPWSSYHFHAASILDHKLTVTISHTCTRYWATHTHLKFWRDVWIWEGFVPSFSSIDKPSFPLQGRMLQLSGPGLENNGDSSRELSPGLSLLWLWEESTLRAILRLRKRPSSLPHNSYTQDLIIL